MLVIKANYVKKYYATILHLGEFDIIVITPSGLRRQALSDLLGSPLLEGVGLYTKTFPMKRYALLPMVNGALPVMVLPHGEVGQG